MDAIKEIQAVRARWAELQAEAAESTRLADEEVRRQALAVAERIFAPWLLEHFGEIDRFGDGYAISLLLPGCAPVRFFMFESGNLDCITVREAVRIDYESGKWRVVSATHQVDSPIEAVDLAASFGESWHEMQAEADRRNAEGLKPPPTPLDKAQKALDEARSTYDTAPETTTALIAAVASAGIAIAEQLALLNNTLMKMGR